MTESALVFVDLETRLCPDRDRVTEIGLVTVKGDTGSHWTTLTNPGVKVSEGARRLDSLIERHGITTFIRHRALPDAQSIGRFWELIRQAHTAQRLATTVAELAWLSKRLPRIRAQRIVLLTRKEGGYES